MRAEFGDKTAGKFAVQTPIDQALEFRVIVGHWPPPAVITVPISINLCHFADLAGGDHAYRFAEPGRVMVLQTDLVTASALLHRLKHLSALLDGKRHALLTINMVPAVESCGHVLVMKRQRSGNDHRIDVFPRQELAIVANCRGIRTDDLARLFPSRFVYVA